jgi:hypothetical protein
MMAALCAVALVAPVRAASHASGEFSQFRQCPLNIKTISECVFAVTEGGSFTVGRKTVPLVHPITLQGGFEGSGEEISFYGAKNGETLSKTPQPVPGGLAGVTAPSSWPESLQTWFDEQLEEGETEAKATLELAAAPESIQLNTENLLLEHETALGVPARIKLENPLLGSACHTGSEEEPAMLELTTGASGKLNGSRGKFTFKHELSQLTTNGAKLVDGTFKMPGATGCGGIFSYFIDPLVDSGLGTPSPRGKNRAALEGKLEAAAVSLVK